jgi:adenylate cyclase
MFEKALVLDSEYATAYAFLGFTYLWEWMFWNPKSQVKQQALTLAQKAVALEDSLPYAHSILGGIYAFDKQPEQAIREGERALALNPNFADGYVWLGHIMNYMGKPEHAIELIQQAQRLNPTAPFFYSAGLAHAHYLLQQYEEAIAACKRSLSLNPDNAAAHIYLAFTYVELSRKDDARAEIREALGLIPLDLSQRLKNRLPYTDQAVVDRVLDSVQKALATLSVRDYLSLVTTKVSRYFHLGGE